LNNRCEFVPSETIGQNLCRGHTCVKDDNPNLPSTHNKGFCDCYSGWSGNQCDTKEIGTADVLPPVEETNGIFTPAIPLLEAQDGNNPKFAITVTIPSRQSPLHNPNNAGSVEGITRLSFKPPQMAATTSVKRNDDLAISSKRDVSPNPNACNYPNNHFWEIDTTQGTSGWVDSYHNSFGYSELANCGLTYVRSDLNFAYFNTTLIIERDFTLGNGRFSFNRKFSVDQVISIAFPRNLAVSSNVVVSNNTVEFYGAMTELKFNPFTQTWSITIGTTINKPFYKLQLVSAANPHPTVRDWTAVAGSNIVSCPGGYSADCVQQWKFETHSCDALNIAELVMNFKVVCISGTTPDVPAECANPNPETIQAKFAIKTASACPKSDEFKILDDGKVLSSYSTNSYATPKALFGISETMYLAVDFVSPPANIDHIKVAALCAYPQFTNPSDVPASCDPAHSVVLDPNVHTESSSNYKGHKIAFNVVAGKLKAAAGVAEEVNKITIQVQLEISYDGTIASGSKRLSSSTQLYALSTDLIIEGEQMKEENEEIQSFDESSASTISIGLCAVLLLLATLF